MPDTMNAVDHHEPFAFWRLLIRSSIFGFLVPVREGEFWHVTILQVVSALVICLVLYGLEKTILWPFRKRLSIRPLHSAAYRGALLYALLILAGSPGDVMGALGAAIAGALVAMGLFKLESRIIIKLA